MSLTLEQALAELPLVAILRGITPAGAVAMGRMLVDEGFRVIEVPLNSPQPLDSIAALAAALRGRALVGAGTVLRVAEVAAVRAAGGALVVSPDARPDVVRATRAAGMVSIPGFATATEALAALDAGASALKLFPAEAASPRVLTALRAVLPAGTAVLPVGGIDAAAMAPWFAAGAAGFGLGSALYRPGDTVATVRERAVELVRAARALHG